MHRSTDPQYYRMERTSACSGVGNPDGWGWVLVYEKDENAMEIIIPDNVMNLFIEKIKKHYERVANAD